MPQEGPAIPSPRIVMRYLQEGIVGEDLKATTNVPKVSYECYFPSSKARNSTTKKGSHIVNMGLLRSNRGSFHAAGAKGTYGN